MDIHAQTAEVRLAHPDELFIGGRWTRPHGAGRLAIISPHTEEVTHTVAEASESDMDHAVSAARLAFDEGPWPRLTPHERAEFLRRLHAALERRVPELVRAWTDQIGSLASQSPFVIGAGMQTLDYYIGLADTYPFVEPRQPADGHGDAAIIREPVGVVVAIVPWNNPFGIMISKIAPALLAGCTVIMKPAPETPLDAHIIAEAGEAAGLPPGVLNLVPSGREAADHLIRRPGVDKVSLTGSTVAGRRVAMVCGERLARYTLELGGKSAAVVLDDYDMTKAARVVAASITLSAGQVCAALSRAIVPRRREAEFIDAVTAETRAIRVGDPFDPATQLGPLAMKRQRERVESYVAVGVAEGARLVTGGSRPSHMNRGYYYEPTVLASVTPDMRVAREEIFGPVLSVLAYDDEDHAARLANDSEFGLYGSVFTHDRERAWSMARAMRVGTIAHNSFRFDPHLPFGGFKQSGVGREGGEAGLDAYTELKSILLDSPAL
jgi:aldehyde dehydrogenase (NAD+)